MGTAADSGVPDKRARGSGWSGYCGIRLSKDRFRASSAGLVVRFNHAFQIPSNPPVELAGNTFLLPVLIREFRGLEAGGEWGGTMNIGFGPGIELRSRGGRSDPIGDLESCGTAGGAGWPAQIVLCQFQRRGEVRADAGYFFRGRGDPLIQGGANAAALRLLLDHDEAHEVSSGTEPDAHGMVLREHAVEDERHVVIFEELGDGEHAARGLWSSAIGFRIQAVFRRFAQGLRGGRLHMSNLSHVSRVGHMRNLFGQGEYTWLAGDRQKTVVGLATEPAR